MSTPADYISSGLSDYNMYRGATSGNPIGQTRAGLQATKLAGNYMGDSALNTGATGALDALGIYQGLQQGGWQGDTRAAASALQMAGALGGESALSTAGSGILIPLDVYNEINNWQSGNTASDAEAGATTGAAVGSVVPGLGTVVGGVVGGALGALTSAFGPGEKDAETSAVQNVIDATGQYGNNPGVAASVQNPYLEMAGLMDRRSSTLPEYQQYGRMGEQQFTNDLVGKINQAVTANPSLGNNPNAVYNQVVSPWVNSMGSGYNNVGQTYTATNQGLLQDMTNEYMSGNAAHDWTSVGGQSPFQDIYKNSPFQAQYQAATAQREAQDQKTTAADVTALASRAPRSLTSTKFSSGGDVSKNNVRSRLKHLYEGSFADRARHYDDGGYVDYFTPSSDSPTWQATDPFYTPPDQSSLVPIDTSSANAQLDEANQSGVDNINNPYAGSSMSGGGGGGGGILSGLGSALGVSSLGQLLQKYGALAPLLAAAAGGGNKPASAPATPSGYNSSPSNIIHAPATYSRQYTQPNVQNWYTYGEGPEQSFFSNNQLPTVQGFSPNTQGATQASGGGAGSTTPQSPPIGIQPYLLNSMRGMSEGGAFDSTQGDSYVADPGHGDGTSDAIDAKLSGGEYVMDAGTVSMLGNGSNEAGSRALDQLRARIRKHAGKQLVKGKQFMKAKPAESYLRGGKSS
jgi:hypothetical protein